VKPYYERDGVQLYLGDCREVLPALGVKADVFIADPPYNETSLKWDKKVDGWLPVMRASMSPRGSMWTFGSLRLFMRTAAEFEGWNLAQDVVWEKHNGSNFHADRFKRVHEIVAQFWPSDRPWGGIYKDPQKTASATPRQVRRKQRPTHMEHIDARPYVSEDGGPRLMRSVFFVRSCHGYADQDTQKPEDLVAPLVKYSCPPGGLVVSPFAGSGTDLVVAMLSGRRAIGVEILESHAEVAARRLSEVLPFSKGAA
jgi:site-specific DNA-methyltransferase (adenine-specific)